MVTVTNPHDAAIRAVLLEQLRAARPRALVVQEYDVPRARVDVAVFDQTLDAFEIKSAHDGRGRLARQAEVYGHIFDHCIAVVAPKHLLHLAGAVPSWWGILVADGGELVAARSPRQNLEQRASSLAWLLWAREAAQLVRRLGLTVRSRYSRASKPDHVDALASVPLDVLRAAVLEALRARTDWRLPDGRSVEGARLAAERACKGCGSRRRSCRRCGGRWCPTCDKSCTWWLCRRAAGEAA